MFVKKYKLPEAGVALTVDWLAVGLKIAVKLSSLKPGSQQWSQMLNFISLYVFEPAPWTCLQISIVLSNCITLRGYTTVSSYFGLC